MGYKRPPSAADQELSACVAAEAGHLSSRSIRTYRSEGLIAKAWLTRQGYARPVIAKNPPEAFDQAFAIAEVRGSKRIRLSDLVFGLFDNAYPVDIEVLRRAYTSWFEGVLRELKEVADRVEDDLALAEEIARGALKHLRSSKQGRFMAKQARRVAKARRDPAERSDVVSEEAMLIETLTVLGMVMIGGDLRHMDHSGEGAGRESDAIENALEVTGLAGFHEDRVGEIGPIIDSTESHRNDLIELWGPMFSLESLYEFSQRVEYEQLVRGRDHARYILSLSDAVARNSAMTDGPSNAFGMAMVPYLTPEKRDKAMTALMIARLEEHIGREQFEFISAFLQPELGRQRAFQGITEQLPRRMRRYVGIQGAERQKRAGNEILTQLRGRLDEIQAHHPELFEAISADRTSK
jgi:hypothetical protein